MKVFQVNEHLIAALCEEDAADFYARKICLQVCKINCMEMTEAFRDYIDDYEFWRKCQMHQGRAGDPFFVNLD